MDVTSCREYFSATRPERIPLFNRLRTPQTRVCDPKYNASGREGKQGSSNRLTLDFVRFFCRICGCSMLLVLLRFLLAPGGVSGV